MGDPGPLGKTNGSTETPSSNLNWSNAKINELFKVRSFALLLGITAGRCTSHDQPAYRPECAQRWQLDQPEAQAQAASTPSDPQGAGSGPAVQHPGLPVPTRTPDPARPFSPQTKGRERALLCGDEKRSLGFSRSPGRPQLPTSQSFLRPRAPSPLLVRPRGLPSPGAQSPGSAALSSELGSRLQEPERWARRWRAWSLQPYLSPPDLGFCSTTASAGFQHQAPVRWF